MTAGFPTCSHVTCVAPARCWPRLVWAAQDDDEHVPVFSALLERPVCRTHAREADAADFVTAETWDRIRREMHAQGRPAGDIATLVVEFVPILPFESFAGASARSASERRA